jgi:hypothetical protein
MSGTDPKCLYLPVDGLAIVLTALPPGLEAEAINANHNMLISGIVWAVM